MAKFAYYLCYIWLCACNILRPAEHIFVKLNISGGGRRELLNVVVAFGFWLQSENSTGHKELHAYMPATREYECS